MQHISIKSSNGNGFIDVSIVKVKKNKPTICGNQTSRKFISTKNATYNTKL